MSDLLQWQIDLLSKLGLDHWEVPPSKQDERRRRAAENRALWGVDHDGDMVSGNCVDCNVPVPQVTAYKARHRFNTPDNLRCPECQKEYKTDQRIQRKVNEWLIPAMTAASQAKAQGKKVAVFYAVTVDGNSTMGSYCVPDICDKGFYIPDQLVLREKCPNRRCYDLNKWHRGVVELAYEGLVDVVFIYSSIFAFNDSWFQDAFMTLASRLPPAIEVIDPLDWKTIETMRQEQKRDNDAWKKFLQAYTEDEKRKIVMSVIKTAIFV